MENLIEKLKGLDKKVWIGIGIGAAVVIILIVALIIGSGNNKPSGSTQGSSQGNSQVGTQAGTQAGTEGIGTENLATEALGTEMSTEIETEIGTETEMTESESESQSQTPNNNQGGNQSNNNQSSNNTPTPGVGGTTVTQPEDVNGVEQKPVTTTPEGEEILGEGSKDQPLEVIPDAEGDALVLETIEVPAGKTVYYLIQRVGGMYFNIEDSGLYVIDSAGNRHDSSFVIENAMANENVLFQIGNSSNSNKKFTLRFTNLGGTYQNPQVISELGASKSLAKGDQVGWYYKYKATATGTIRFYISYTKESDLIVTNLNTSAVRNFTSDANGAEYIEIAVTAGDELLIQVCAVPDKRWQYPATDITWRGEYVQ